ncbi:MULTISPECIES: LysR family transcriptional regulator [Vibrio]|uniref:LysR family transcriptional regulator n=2 Tax=Vibrio TaxID=662 RepID=A0A7X4LLU8_9VIBR|nr:MULTISPECIES: LysR family transcriptional regulator [Vibrio]MBF9000259.1 LysR family transcriptional regulator [Vibrio nitrifigilis]MZI94279.1 LysR family transcriptional regulator [Vibrio eleionomae]
MINFATTDLNLLKTLDVLLTEHNVTRAAQRLHLSQPSVSVHLAKLRELFNDPLLIPSSRGMKPTLLAEELRQPLRNALQSLEMTLNNNQVFNPVLENKTWKIAAADYAEFIVIKPVMKNLIGQSSHSKLAIKHMIPDKLVRQLERGEIDIAFHVRDDSLGELKSRILLTEHYVLTARKTHPSLRPKIDLKQFSGLKHAIVSPNGGGFSGETDTLLKALGIERNVVLSVPNFYFLIDSIKQSDLVAMLPSRLVTNDPELQIIELPFTPPSFELVMLWHPRSHSDPAHQWLRDQVLNTALIH